MLASLLLSAFVLTTSVVAAGSRHGQRASLNSHLHRSVAAQVEPIQAPRRRSKLAKRCKSHTSSTASSSKPSATVVPSVATTLNATSTSVAITKAETRTSTPASHITTKAETKTSTSASQATVPAVNVAPEPASSSTSSTVPSTTAKATSSKSQEPATTTKAQPTAESTGTSNSAGSFLSGVNTGEATYYSTGLGSCGIVNTDTDYIAAVSHLLYDSYPGYVAGNPNSNPVCNKKIVATYQGKSVTITVTDRCEGCAMTDLDFSPSAFNSIADPSAGRLTGMTWKWA